MDRRKLLKMMLVAGCASIVPVACLAKEEEGIWIFTDGYISKGVKFRNSTLVIYGHVTFESADISHCHFLVQDGGLLRISYPENFSRNHLDYKGASMMRMVRKSTPEEMRSWEIGDVLW